MDRQEAITRLCALASRVGSEVFNHERAHDCFCENEFSRHDPLGFRFGEPIIEFIEKSVLDAIEAIPSGMMQRIPVAHLEAMDAHVADLENLRDAIEGQSK